MINVLFHCVCYKLLVLTPATKMTVDAVLIPDTYLQIHNTCMTTLDRMLRKLFPLPTFCVTRTLQHFNNCTDIHFIIPLLV
jgi:hypothetical protein